MENRQNIKQSDARNKKILLIATGGTIASQNTARGLAPSLTADELLRHVSNLQNICQVETVQLMNLDSTNINQEHWLKMAATIHKAYDQYDGFVIFHGTDTMAYTSAALSYLIQDSPKPVVLTGAQKPIHAEITDSKSNIYSSFLYAASEQACGVQILFDGKVIAGTRARKTHSKSFHAFSSMNFPCIATVQGNRIIRYIAQETGAQPIFYDRLDTGVALLRLIPGMDADILDFMLEKNKAVVIESYGIGGIPSLKEYRYYDVIEKWLKKQRIIVMTTQVPNEGSELGAYEVAYSLKQNDSILEAYDMTTESVVTKLMWILGQTDDREKIQELFYGPVGNDLLYLKEE